MAAEPLQLLQCTLRDCQRLSACVRQSLALGRSGSLRTAASCRGPHHAAQCRFWHGAAVYRPMAGVPGDGQFGAVVRRTSQTADAPVFQQLAPGRHVGIRCPHRVRAHGPAERGVTTNLYKADGMRAQSV